MLLKNLECPVVDVHKKLGQLEPYFNLEAIWFQHDGATPHLAYETILLYKDKFNNLVTSTKGDVNSY